jgi:hypothetical protein
MECNLENLMWKAGQSAIKRLNFISAAFVRKVATVQQHITGGHKMHHFIQSIVRVRDANEPNTICSVDRLGLKLDGKARLIRHERSGQRVT